MEIRDENFRIWAENEYVYFEGILRLAGPEAYAPIYSLALSALHANHAKVVFDLTGLEFLNSSGINLLAKLTIEARKNSAVQLVIRGTSQHPWQSKSLPNLKKLYPQLDLQIA